MRPGRLLVKAILSEAIDHNLGIMLASDEAPTALATVIKTSDSESFPEGAVIMHDRLFGRGINLTDDNGEEQQYAVVAVSDVSLIITP